MKRGNSVILNGTSADKGNVYRGKQYLNSGMKAGDKQADETQDSLIGESERRPSMSLEPRAKERDSVTPIDLDHTTNSARNEHEVSPLTQKLVKVASHNDNEIAENEDEDSVRQGQPRGSDAD